jgi:hypothetical protein
MSEESNDFPDATNTDNMFDAEKRNYELNTIKTGQKMINASEREDVKINETAGGITLQLNTELYTKIKVAAGEFYGSGKLTKLKCQIIPVCDRKGNSVETKYKLTEGRTHLYTLNLYHTRCSALVNGKHARRFIDIDFPEILNIVELNTSCLSLDENTDPKQLHTSDIRPSDAVLNIECLDENTNIKILHSSVIKTSKAASDVENSPNINSSNLPDNCFADLSEVKEILIVLRDEIYQLKSNLSAHVEITASQLSRLRDEIASVKSHSNVVSQATQSQIEEVQNSVKIVETKVSTSTDILQRRLQSITDNIKSIPKTVSPLIEKDNRNDSADNLVPAQFVFKTPMNNSKLNSQVENVPMKTLIIGDSILKEVHRRGLQSNVEVKTLRGATTKELHEHLLKINVLEYRSVVLYIGGNDTSNRKSLRNFEDDLVEIINFLQKCKCDVFICNICPRVDTDTVPVNDLIEQLCKRKSVNYINCYSSFVFADGTVAKSLYMRDGIHLNKFGTSSLLKSINKHVSIFKRRTEDQRETSGYWSNDRQHPRSTHHRAGNFNTRQSPWGDIRYGRAPCWICGRYNHNSNACHYRSKQLPPN